MTTVLTCAGGETVTLVLDTTLPRAYYSRNFSVRGTRGMSSEERQVVFLEGMKEVIANNEEEMYAKYDPPARRVCEKGRQGRSRRHGLAGLPCLYREREKQHPRRCCFLFFLDFVPVP